MEDKIMGRLLSEQTYDNPAEYAEVYVSTRFVVSVFVCVDDPDILMDGHKAVGALLEEFKWNLTNKACPIRVKPWQGEKESPNRWVEVSIEIEYEDENSGELPWFTEYIEDPEIWERDGDAYAYGEVRRKFEELLVSYLEREVGVEGDFSVEVLEYSHREW